MHSSFILGVVCMDVFFSFSFWIRLDCIQNVTSPVVKTSTLKSRELKLRWVLQSNRGAGLQKKKNEVTVRSLSSWNMFIGNLTEIDLLFRSFPLLQIRPLSSMYFFPSQKLQILNFPIHLSAIKYFLWHFLWILALVMLNGILYSSWTFPCWFFPFTIYFDHRYMVVEVPWCQLLKHLLCNAGHLTLYDKMVYSPQKLHQKTLGQVCGKTSLTNGQHMINAMPQESLLNVIGVK